GSTRTSCRMIRRKFRRLPERATMPVPPVHLMKNRNEHRWNILEKILRLRPIEERGMLAQFVRDLINDEVAAVRERFIRFRQQGAFLFDFENAERDTGKNVVAVRDTP